MGLGALGHQDRGPAEQRDRPGGVIAAAPPLQGTPLQDEGARVFIRIRMEQTAGGAKEGGKQEGFQ